MIQISRQDMVASPFDVISQTVAAPRDFEKINSMILAEARSMLAEFLAVRDGVPSDWVATQVVRQICRSSCGRSDFWPGVM